MNSAQQTLTFHRAVAGRVQIGKDALATLQRHRQITPGAHEAGGVLLGRYILETDDIVIDLVTTPQPGDTRSRFRFTRARKRHQELIDEAWSTSSQTTSYLGEWHTHPEVDPTPSPIDRAAWIKKSMIDEFADAIFFVIVGTERISVWEGRKHRPWQIKLNEGTSKGDST